MAGTPGDASSHPPAPPPPPKVQTHSFSWCEVRCLLCSHQFCTFMWTASMAEHAGAAKRRRERRLRQFLRHERQTVAMLLAETQHHAAPRGQNKARSGGEGRGALQGHVPGAPLPQGRVLRHVVGHLPVPALDVPVPQMENQLVECAGSSILLFPSWLSKCRRSHLHRWALRTTPQEARRKSPAPGWDLPSTMNFPRTMAGPPGGGSGQWHCRSPGRRGRWSGTTASRTSWSRLSMLLCCRWWNSCRMSCSSWQRSWWWLPSRLSKKILPHDIPPRRWCRDTQLVEQLVEVPTPVSYSSLLQRTVEQHVDIPMVEDLVLDQSQTHLQSQREQHTCDTCLTLHHHHNRNHHHHHNNNNHNHNNTTQQHHTTTPHNNHNNNHHNHHNPPFCCLRHLSKQL